MRRILIAVAALLVLGPPAAEAHRADDVRFATYNLSLNRPAAGDLVNHLSHPEVDDVFRRQARNVAEVIQRARPDVILINEFDYDPAAVDLFRDNFLEVSQNGADPIEFPYAYVATSNTGVPSGKDLDNNGTIGGGNDAFGFGAFPGQFGMVVYSKYPIDTRRVRTFQHFLWKDMPGNRIPTPFYSPDEVDILRLSSKSHWTSRSGSVTGPCTSSSPIRRRRCSTGRRTATAGATPTRSASGPTTSPGRSAGATSTTTRAGAAGCCPASAS
jgi:Endonuclease/Exonuclease/phosphatase family